MCDSQSPNSYRCLLVRSLKFVVYPWCLCQVDAALGASVAQREGRGYSVNSHHPEIYGNGRTPISLYHLLLEVRNMDEHQCSVLFSRQTNTVLSLKLSFKKAVPQIKYNHTFKSTDFNWRRWTSIFFFTGKLVVRVVLVVIGVQHVVCVPFCTSRFYERCNKERERGRERGIGRDRERERERKREKHRTRKRERERDRGRGRGKGRESKREREDKNIKRTRKKKRKRDYCFEKKHGLPFF